MISVQDYYKYSRELEKYHEVFYQFWEMGEPRFTNEIKTAAIAFSRHSGKPLEFIFNPFFWSKLSDYERVFVICHEMLHIIFNHGVRAKGLIDKIANIAEDVSINETLIRNFGFDIDLLPNIFSDDPEDETRLNGCLIKTVFKGRKDIPYGKNFEFYYNKIMENAIIIDAFDTVDEHDGFGGIDIGDLGDELDIRHNGDKIKENINKLAGKDSGARKLKVKAKVEVKRKWESIMRKWTRRYKGNEEDEQWIRENRRILTLPKTMFIPADLDSIKPDNNRIKVALFQDTSGSCVHLVDRFYNAALSFPRDKFDIDTYCFDTSIYPVNPRKREVKGGGGTSFHIISNYIDQNYKQHPDAIFIITDGYGDKIVPKQPEKWFWFLTEKHTSCIPKECNIFDLAEFE